jgi:hypothetical protein
MKRFILFSYVVFSFLICLSAPAHAAQWAKTYGGTGDESGGIWPASGGGYYLLGYLNSATTDTIFAKLTSGGSVSWAKKIGGPAQDLLSVVDVSGGFLVTGMTNSFGTAGGLNLVWAKFDSSWNPAYQKVFGGEGNEMGGFYETTDGGLFFSGGSNSYGTSASDKDILLVKIKPSGAIAWKKVFHYGSQDQGGYMLEVSDGYLVSGETQNPPTSPLPGILLIKLSKTTGVPQWIKLYKHPTGMLSGTEITKLSGGGFLLTGSLMSLSGDNRIVLMKTNSNGVVQWQKSYGKASCSVMGHVVTENPDHTLILSGTITDPAGTSGTLVMKLSSTGGILWKKRLGAKTEINAGFISKSETGQVLLSGSHTTGPSDDHYKILYSRLDPTTYSPIWAKVFGGDNYDSGAVTKLTGGYLMEGTTTSFGPGTPSKYNIFGMILDADGNYPNCHITPITLPVDTNPGVTSDNPGITTVNIPSFDTRTAGAPTNISLTVTPMTLQSKAICPSVAGAADFPADEELETLDEEIGTDSE